MDERAAMMSDAVEAFLAAAGSREGVLLGHELLVVVTGGAAVTDTDGAAGAAATDPPDDEGAAVCPCQHCRRGAPHRQDDIGILNGFLRTRHQRAGFTEARIGNE